MVDPVLLEVFNNQPMNTPSVYLQTYTAAYSGQGAA
jgi:hypothetical protein